MPEKEEVRYKLPGVTPADWTISELYNRSFKLIKKYKVLWVFGTAVAAFAGGTSLNYVSRLSNFNTKDLNKLLPSPSPNPSLEINDKVSSIQFPNVLGTSTDSLSGLLQSLLSSIPTYLWVVLGLEIFILIIAGIVINIIRNAWANAALLEAVQSAFDNKDVSIRDSSKKAFTSIKSLAWLSIIPSLILVFGALLILGTLIFITFSAHGVAKIIFSLLTIFASLVTTYLAVYLGLARIWAQRLVVYDNRQWKEALFSGYRISRKKKWAMLLLGIVNAVLGIVVTMVPLLVIGLFGVGGFLGLQSIKVLGIGLLIIAGILLLIFILGSLLLSGILTAFKTAVWTIAYHKIRGKYED